MTDFNKKQFSENYELYLENNPEGKIGGGTIQERVALLKRYLPVNRRVFEIGSAGGKDALELQLAGYTVLASDFIPEFVELLRKQNLSAIQFDATKDQLPDKINALYANAVFVHLNREEIEQLLNSAKEKLQNEKIVFISTIKGQGYERTPRGRGFDRDFYYYEIPELVTLLEQQDFKVLVSRVVDEKWIQIIAAGK